MAFSAVIGSLRAVLGLDSAAFEEGLGAAQKELRKFGRDMEKLGKQISDVGKTMTVALTVPIVGFGAAAVKASGDFEAAMNRVGAATQANTRDLKAMADQAKALGANTQFSATEAATAMEMLAKNGLTAQQILGGATDATVMLAAASDSELAPAADLATDVMLNFGKSAGELKDVVNGVTGVLLASKFGFDDYRLAMGQAGGVAGPLGVTLEDFNATIAATSSAFASGSDAGTSFKTFLQRLAPQSKEAAEMMKALGLSFFDAQGRMLPMAEIAQRLRNSIKGLNDEAKSKALVTMFGTDAIRTAVLLAQQGADGINRLKEAIADASAEEQAQARMKGFNGELKALKSAIEALMIAIGESGLLAVMTDLVKSLTDWIRELAKASPETLKWVTIIAGATAALGPLLVVTGSVIKAIGGFSTALAGLLPIIGRLAIAIGPAGWLIAGLAAAAGLFVLLGQNMGPPKKASDELSDALDRLNKKMDDQKKAAEAAGKSMRELAADNIQAARSALAASEAQLAARRQIASEQGSLSFLSVGTAMSGIPMAGALAQGEADRAVTEAEKELAAAQADLEAAKIRLIQIEEEMRLGPRLNQPSTSSPSDGGSGGGSGLPPGVTGGGRKKREEFPDQFDAMMDDWREFQKMAAERLRDQNEATERAEYELALLGKSGDEQERLLALFDKRNELARTYGDITNANAQAELKAFEQQQAAQERLRATNRTYQELEDFGEQAFDRIGEAATQAATQGSNAGIDFGNIWRGILSELMQEFIKLALLNPIKNALGIGGGNLETITTVISGLGSIFGGGIDAGYGYSGNTGAGGNGSLSYGGPRASGGRVNPGRWYMTGEKGPEPFMPDTPGRIIPTKDMVAANNNAPTFNNVVNISGDGVTEAQVRRALQENNRVMEQQLSRSWGARQSTYNALRG